MPIKALICNLRMLTNLSEQGFRMPAEWEKQDSIWVVWPYNKNDWPGHFKSIPYTVAKIIGIISQYQKVNLIIKLNEKKIEIKKILKKYLTKISNIEFHNISSDRIWIRDSGPIFLINKKSKKKIFLNFKFNGWSKYNNYLRDNKINNSISKKIDVKKIDVKVKFKKVYKPIVLEGGAIDVNGRGSILLTEECLLSKTQQRNKGFKKKHYEKYLSKLLNVNNFIWLKKGIEGDDTHGHIDDISRFVSENTIMTAVENDKSEKNFQILNNNLEILKKTKNKNKKRFRIIKIPMPKPIFINKTKVPASYLNFLITNKIVLVPIFEDKNDIKVIQIFKKIFKKRKIIGINCKKLIWGFGAIHCMTLQEPSI